MELARLARRRTSGSPTPCTSTTPRSRRSAATGTGVAHCPSSNARLGAGHRPRPRPARRRRAGRARRRRRGVQRGRLAARGAAARACCSPGPRGGPQALTVREALRDGHARRRPGARPGRRDRLARGRASSPTSRCGGSTRSPTPTSPTRSPRWCSARRRRWSCCWSTAGRWSSSDRLVTVDEERAGRATCAPPASAARAERWSVMTTRDRPDRHPTRRARRAARHDAGRRHRREPAAAGRRPSR